MEIVGIVAMGISFLAVLVAVWQGLLAKQQLNAAKATRDETGKLLEDIKAKVVRIESISDETRTDVRQQITRLVDKQDENFKFLLRTPNEQSQNQMIADLLPTLLQQPDALKTIMDVFGDSKE